MHRYSSEARQAPAAIQRHLALERVVDNRQPGIARPQHADKEVGQRQSVDYAIAAGCRNPATTARCLRALPATRLERPPWYYFIGDSDALSGPVTGTAVGDLILAGTPVPPPNPQAEGIVVAVTPAQATATSL